MSMNERGPRTKMGTEDRIGMQRQWKGNRYLREVKKRVKKREGGRGGL